MMRWTRPMNRAAARDLLQTIHARQDNPSRTEKRRRTGRRRPPRAGLCPRFARILRKDGKVVIGFEAGSWAAARFRAALPDAAILTRRPKEANEDD